MRQAQGCRRRRAAFTLVELLIVITIIIILFSLATGAVINALRKADEVRLRNDITQLSNSIHAFKTQFGVSYVPDNIVLQNVYAVGDQNLGYLTNVWPRLSLTPDNPSSPTQFTVTWDTNGAFAKIIANSGGQITLQGDRCLVFFLGGMRDPNTIDVTKSATNQPNTAAGRIGFSTNPRFPMDATSLSGRVGPFYDFPPSRLTPGTSYFPDYNDVWGTPYAYFTARKAGNDYTVFTAGANFGKVLPDQNGLFPYQASGALPTATGSNGVLPSRVWVNRDSFQIISAGRDGKFGTGGLNWAGSTTTNADQDGYDNYSNFHPVQLGIPAQ